MQRLRPMQPPCPESWQRRRSLNTRARPGRSEPDRPGSSSRLCGWVNLAFAYLSLRNARLRQIAANRQLPNTFRRLRRARFSLENPTDYTDSRSDQMLKKALLLCTALASAGAVHAAYDKSLPPLPRAHELSASDIGQ